MSGIQLRVMRYTKKYNKCDLTEDIALLLKTNQEVTQILDLLLKQFLRLFHTLEQFLFLQ